MEGDRYTGPAIYIIRNIKDGKFYIGSAKNYYLRFYHKSSGHLSKLNKGTHHNIHLQRAWSKYGASCFEFDILEKIEDASILIPREQFYIDSMMACELGYNINPTANNRQGIILSAEIKNKISLSRRGKCVGSDNGFFGKKHTDETKKIISDKNKGKFGKANPFYGKKHNEDTKLKISRANTGRVVSEETRNKISTSMSGDNNPMFGIKKLGRSNPFYGKNHTQDTKDKIRSTKKNLIPVNAYLSDGSILNFPSLREASKFYGFHKTTIKRMCQSGISKNGIIFRCD